MHRNAGKLMSILAGLALLVSTVSIVSTAEPASAAGCSQTGCNGQDAGTTGCADSRTYDVYTREINYYASANFWANMRIYLRYSPTCGTNWAKAVVVSSNPPSYGYQMQVQLKDEFFNYVDGTSAMIANTRSIYGNMRYAPTTPMRACAAINSPNFPGGLHCTAAG